MKAIYIFDKYLKDDHTDIESDEFTRALVKSYFQEEALRQRWTSILQKEYNYGQGAAAVLPSESRSQKKNRAALVIGSIMAIAACALLMWNVLSTSAVDLNPIDQLLSEHYAKPYTRDILKGPAVDSNDRLRAYDYYQQQNYLQAIPLLEKTIAAEGVARDSDHFFLGLSYLYSDQAVAANEQFTYILNQDDSLYKDAATWYLALGLTDSGNYEAAKIYLQQIMGWDGNGGKRKLAASAAELMEMIDGE